VSALLVQCISLLIVYILAIAAAFSFHIALSGWSLVLIQSGISTMMACAIGMAIWWRFIHFLFPITLVSMLSLQMPVWIYLVGFAVTASVFWSTFRTQVPYYPSHLRVWQAVEKLLPSASPARVVDIGSGMGGFTLYLARHRPADILIGVEIAPLPWLVSWLRAHAGRSRARFLRGDYTALDFAEFDLVFAYLSPAAMPALWKKASREMRKNTLLVSYEFDIPAISPTFVIEVGAESPQIYVWRL
jgi:SAM-dependent methyltransferase